MNTGLDTTQTIGRAPRNLALSTFIQVDQAPASEANQPWILDHQQILRDLPYAEDDLVVDEPNPFLQSVVGAVGSGAARRSRQLITVFCAAVLAGLVYLALQGTLLRPADSPITYDTTPAAEPATSAD